MHEEHDVGYSFEEAPRADHFTYHVKAVVEKYANEEDYLAGKVQEVIVDEGNMVVYGGYSALWSQLIGAGVVTAFNNANAHTGVGDSSTAAALTQTDLQAATNK